MPELNSTESNAKLDEQQGNGHCDEHDELSRQLEKNFLENEVEAAKKLLSAALEKNPHHTTLQLWSHKLAVRESNMAKAVQIFIELHSESMENEMFQSYIVDLANHISDGHGELFDFFCSLSPLYQRAVLDYAIDQYRQEGENYRAACILLSYVQNFPKLSARYLLTTARLFIKCETDQDISLSPDNIYRSKLVKELIPHIYKHAVSFCEKGMEGSVDTVEGKSILAIPYDEFAKLVRLGQGYYLSRKEWDQLSQFTSEIIECCGYKDFNMSYNSLQPDYISAMKQARSGINVAQRPAHGKKSVKPATETVEQVKARAAIACEMLIIAAHLARIGYEYFNLVCLTSENTSNSDEKLCLIPICVLPENNPSHENGSKTGFTLSEDPQLSAKPYRNSLNIENIDENSRVNGNPSPDNIETISRNNEDSSDSNIKVETIGKRSRPSPMVEKSSPSNGAMRLSNLIHDSAPTPKRQKVDGSETDVDKSDCLKGTSDALFALKKGAECLAFLEQLWQELGQQLQNGTSSPLNSWEEELSCTFESYDLPFDLYNSILLLQSDIALSAAAAPGNLAKALKLSQNLCDRIEVQRAKEKAAMLTSSMQELDIPFMLAFRVLYNIGIIYLMVGNIQQSTLEIAIILSVFPVTRGLTEDDFAQDEANCKKAMQAFGGQGFGLMRLTQQALVARCIKHLMVGLDYESEQRGSMASLDAAIRWDEKAGNMLVLMQYGWPYWKERTNYWSKIVDRMKEKKTFKNRAFLEYTHLPEILHTLQFLHESGAVRLDIIPPEYSQNSAFHLYSPGSTPSSSVPSSPVLTHSPPATPPNSSSSVSSGQSGARALPSLSSLPLYHAPPPPPPIYQPASINTILPSMSMSPSWYSASTQKNLHANWMSPSFYYSRPATSVLLPKRGSLLHGSPVYGGDQLEQHQRRQQQQQFQSKDVVSRCLQYRLQKYSPKATPSRMRFVLQKFLKNMVVRANADA